MKTRYAPSGAPLSQERYMSSPEYAELRGISGNAVTTKAALMLNEKKRSLLFFLQAMSIKPGGLKSFVREFLEMFPERIGTPTMHKVSIRPGKYYSGETSDKIRRELSLYEDYGEGKPLKTEDCLSKCRAEMQSMPGFIIELCINPNLRFAAPDETPADAKMEGIIIEEFGPEEDRNDPDWRRNQPTYKEASLDWFHDIIGALFEYQRRYQEAVKKEYVHTQVSRLVWDTLDFGRYVPSKKNIVVIEGDSRIGKTTATEAWVNLHLGEARFVSLSGITHKTGLFRALAKVLGIGSSYAKSSTEIQTRVEDVLQRSGLMIVIDEAHHLFSSSERVYSRPELVDWIDTALYNHRVPVALACTPQFAVRMARAQNQTTWNAEQLKGRVKRWQTLPLRPTKEDIQNVARKLLPGACADTIRFLTGHAIASHLPFPALVDAIDETKFLMHREGQQEVSFELVERAIADHVAPSNKAKERAFAAELANKRPGRKPVIPADDLVVSPVPAFVPAPSARRSKPTGEKAIMPPGRQAAPVPSVNGRGNDLTELVA